MSERKYTVYCHRNKTNGFEYIGMTGRDINVRWGSKKRAYDMCTPFRAALDDFGWDGFEHIVLYTGLTKEEAAAKETKLIRDNISNGISYNVREDNDWLGGLRRKKVNVYDLSGNLVDTCESIHAAGIKYKTAETHAYYCACGKKKTVHNKFLFAFEGDDISERLKNALIDKRKNVPAHNRRMVKMMNLNGDDIRIFDSATEAAEFVKSSIGSLVSCCSGKRKSCKGYKWSYV